MPAPKPTAAVLTAHPRWYAAVRERLTDVRRREHPSGTRFDTGALPGTPWEVAVADMGVGNHAAGMIVEQAGVWLRPQVLLFLGSAGTSKGYVNEGDVVVATRVYTHDPQGPAAPKHQPASHRLEQAARVALRRGSGWCGTEATVHFRPVVAVPDEARDEDFSAEEHALAARRGAAAVELMSTGLACAPHLTGPFGSMPETLTIRGVTYVVGRKISAEPSVLYDEVVDTTVTAAVALLTELTPWTVSAAPPIEATGAAPSAYYGGDHIDYRHSTIKGLSTGKSVQGEDLLP